MMDKNIVLNWSHKLSQKRKLHIFQKLHSNIKEICKQNIYHLKHKDLIEGKDISLKSYQKLNLTGMSYIDVFL